MPPFQGIIRCNTGHAPLGIIGGRWEGGSIGYLVVNIAPVGVFLRQKRPDHVVTDRTTTTGF